jgi:hypothetical protein
MSTSSFKYQINIPAAVQKKKINILAQGIALALNSITKK